MEMKRREKLEGKEKEKEGGLTEVPEGHENLNQGADG